MPSACDRGGYRGACSQPPAPRRARSGSAKSVLPLDGSLIRLYNKNGIESKQPPTGEHDHPPHPLRWGSFFYSKTRRAETAERLREGASDRATRTSTLLSRNKPPKHPQELIAAYQQNNQRTVAPSFARTRAPAT